MKPSLLSFRGAQRRRIYPRRRFNGSRSLAALGMTIGNLWLRAESCQLRALPCQVPSDQPEHVARVLGQLLDDGGFEAGVHRAVGAERILARLPVSPVGLVPELVPGGAVLLADQVAGPLPSVGCVGDGAPGRALVVAQSRGEFQKHRSRGQLVLLGDL